MRLLIRLVVVFAVSAAWAGEPVGAPRLWDSGRRIEKPDLSALRVIRFLSDDDYPPFMFQGPDGALTGFNIDLARALCEELKVVCTIQPRRFDTLAEALNEGRGDAAIASLAMTAAAREKLGFTQPYYRTPGRFVMRKGAVADVSPQGLAGKPIAVAAGTAHEAFLRDFFPSVLRKPFETAALARAALKRGEVDALFGDGVTLSIWLEGTDAADCCRFEGGPYLASRYFGEGVGIAVRKDNIVLRQALDWALARVADSGVYAELYLKYFPIGFF